MKLKQLIRGVLSVTPRTGYDPARYTETARIVEGDDVGVGHLSS